MSSDVFQHLHEIIRCGSVLSIQVDTLLNEAELEAEIASVKRRLTCRQLESLTEHIDNTVTGNCSVFQLQDTPFLSNQTPIHFY